VKQPDLRESIGSLLDASIADALMDPTLDRGTRMARVSDLLTGGLMQVTHSSSRPERIPLSKPNRRNDR